MMTASASCGPAGSPTTRGQAAGGEELRRSDPEPSADSTDDQTGGGADPAQDDIKLKS